MKRRIISYNAAELAWIEAHSQDPRRDAHARFCVEFGRHDVSLSNFAALCKRNGWLTGRDGRFDQGGTSWNEGKKMPFNPNSARTRFHKGNRPHNTKHLGHERVSKDGYVEISIAETNPHTGFDRRYVQKHVHLWREKHGPIPKGMCLKCLSGDRTNCDPSNWELVPRALLPRLAGGRWGRTPYDAAPDELKPVVLAIAKLEHKAREKRKSSKSCEVV